MTLKEASKLKKMEHRIQQLSLEVEDLRATIKEQTRQSVEQTRCIEKQSVQIENLKLKKQEVQKILKKRDRTEMFDISSTDKET
jgi:ABC-type uncharacterized transport system fused permease/ATPase subunit